jgi:hypothetical protein
MKSILDRSFRYTPSAETDLRRTFARVRREQKGQVTLTVDNRVPSEVARVISNIAPLKRGAK